MSRNRAFTLSETLAVITIVLLLSSLAMPTLVNAKIAAQKSVCAQNLHQLGIAGGLYLNDYDDRYPIAVNALEQKNPDITYGRPVDLDPNRYPTHHEVLDPYLKESKVWVCPLDTGVMIRGWSARPRLARENGGASYVFADLFAGQTESSWRDPSRLNWACDGSPAWHSPGHNAYDAKTDRVMALAYDLHVYLSDHGAPVAIE